MPALTTKDYSAQKFNKIQKTIGRLIGASGNASQNQCEAYLEQHIREKVQEQDDLDHQALKPEHDPNF